MKDKEKTKDQLINELVKLRQRIAELEASETERKRAEEEIRLLKEKYEDPYNNAPIMYLSLDVNGIIIECNNTILYKLGYTKKEFIGKHITKFISKESEANFKKDFPKLLKTGKILGVERQLVTKNGEIIDVILDVTVEYDEHGKPIKTRATFEDITERKRAEEVIKSSEERLRILFEYAPDGYYLNDLKGNFIDGNIAAEKLIGYKKEELIGKSFLKSKILSPMQIPKAAALLAKNILGQPIGPDELTLNQKDGKQVTVEIRTFPVKIEGQNLVLGIARDITERKHAEEELKKAHDELEMRVKERTAELAIANKQLKKELEEHKQTEKEQDRLQAQLIHSEKMAGIGTLASGIAHEFNNLLQIMRGHTEFAQKTKKAEDIEEAFDTILEFVPK